VKPSQQLDLRNGAVVVVVDGGMTARGA